MALMTITLDGTSFGPMKEGAGSLIEYVIHAYALSVHLKIHFIYTNIKNIGHSEYNGRSQQMWDNEWNIYISRLLIPLNLHTHLYMGRYDMWDVAPIRNKTYGDNFYLLQGIREQLQENYKICATTTALRQLLGADYVNHFTKDGINIAIHIRRYTATDCDPNPVRELYAAGNFMEDYFMKICKYLSNMYPYASIHIYSQGDMDDFKGLQMEGISWHLNTHPILTLHHLITADVFVMSKSSLSFVASIYSQGIKYMKKPARCNMPDVKLIEIDDII